MTKVEKRALGALLAAAASILGSLGIWRILLEPPESDIAIFFFLWAVLIGPVLLICKLCGIIGLYRIKRKALSFEAAHGSCCKLYVTSAEKKDRGAADKAVVGLNGTPVRGFDGYGTFFYAAGKPREAGTNPTASLLIHFSDGSFCYFMPVEIRFLRPVTSCLMIYNRKTASMDFVADWQGESPGSLYEQERPMVRLPLASWDGDGEDMVVEIG